MELLGKAGPDRRCLISHQKHSWRPAGAEQRSAQVTWGACELKFPAGRSQHTAPSSGATPSAKLFTRGHNQSPRPVSVHVALYSRSPNRGTLCYVCVTLPGRALPWVDSCCCLFSYMAAAAAAGFLLLSSVHLHPSWPPSTQHRVQSECVLVHSGLNSL